MTPEEKQQLERAKALIQKKEFALARLLLEVMPANPNARQWIGKLDGIAPATGIPYRPQRQSGSNSNTGIVLLSLAGVILLVVALVVAVIYFSQPERIETDILSLSLATGWESTRRTGWTICDNAPDGCFLVLGTDDEESIILFQEFVGAASGTLDEFHAAEWRSWQGGDPRIELRESAELQIGGQRALRKDFFAPEEDEAPYFLRLIHLYRGSNVIEIIAWSTSEALFDRNRDTIDTILESIEFKAN